MRQQRRLGVEGVAQFGIGPLPAQPGERNAEQGIHLFEQAARFRVGIGQRLSHADNLGSLAGKHERGAFGVESHGFSIRAGI